MKTKPRVVLAAFVIIFSILLIMFGLIGEIIVRSGANYSRPAYEFDKNVLWRLKKNYAGVNQYAAGKVLPKREFKLTFNNHGFRGEDIERKADKTRIMILGDSYTAGLDYPDDEIFTSIVERNLNAKGNLEVINASCPAWGTDQEYIYWMKEGIELNPDYLMIIMAPNDIREAYNKKLCVLKSDGSIEITPPSIPLKERMGWKLANTSSFYQFMQKKWFYTDYGKFMKMFQYHKVNYGIEDDENWDYPIFLKNPFKEVKESFKLVENMLLDIQKSCGEKDIKLIVAVLPSKLEFDGGLNDTLKFETGRLSNWMEKFSKENQIVYLDLYKKLIAKKESPVDIFMSWEYHLNKEGHEFVGEEVSGFLEPFVLGGR